MQRYSSFRGANYRFLASEGRIFSSTVASSRWPLGPAWRVSTVDANRYAVRDDHGASTRTSTVCYCDELGIQACHVAERYGVWQSSPSAAFLLNISPLTVVPLRSVYCSLTTFVNYGIAAAQQAHQATSCRVRYSADEFLQHQFLCEVVNLAEELSACGVVNHEYVWHALLRRRIITK